MLSKTKIIVLFVALFITHSAFAQSIPRYTALVGRKGSGAIKKGELLAQQGVAGIRRINNIHWEHITVDSFDIIVLRDTSQILFFRNKGNKFDEALRTQLKGLIINDRVLIFDIYAKGYPGVSVYLNPLEFKIE